MSSTSDSDVSIPAPVKLAARKSSERKESGLKERKKTSVEGSLRWSGSIGPWEPGMYEFRYFDAGWDWSSDSLLFVPGRAHWHCLPRLVSTLYSVSIFIMLLLGVSKDTIN